MSNRLEGSLSPYLLQHADNPVDWYPWGPDALAAAAASGKPVLLSVGYSACHWCHVMAHESFEHGPTAALMNELFINVKVDREERPDLDRIYQLAHQLLTRRGGGWPLTMFLTHDDQRPFFGGTYFPREARGGLPGFAELLRRVAQFYAGNQAELRAQNTALLEALARIDAPQPSSEDPGTAALTAARQDLEARFDRENGGFGQAPKFPLPAAIVRLLHHWHATAGDEQPDLKALYMATLTLHRMAEGGLMDHLGGGFARYSVDAAWQIPHFEKMLYDNAALLALYSEAFRATGEPFYGEVATATAEFLLRDLRSPEGAFFSALDADSEGEEGRFYVWSRAQVEAALPAEDAALFAARYGLDGPANFEGRWHLRLARPLEELAQGRRFGSDDVAQLQMRLQSSVGQLLALRAQRVPPARDEKVLTGWNALTIRALARAAVALRREDLADAAILAMDFLRREAWRNERLYAVWRSGRAAQPAFLDDHVWLADAALELLEVRFDPALLDFAVALMDLVQLHFAAPGGGYYFTADDSEQLIHRSLRFDDDATPAGNGVAARVLLRLGHLLGQEDYLHAASALLRAAGPALGEQPLGHLTLIESLDEQLAPQTVIVLRGAAEHLATWQTEIRRHYLPRVRLLAIPAELEGLPPALALRVPRGDIVAYVCRGASCSAPLVTLRDLWAALQVVPQS
jgi:uncharacterized protein YyaL (SSP411 family)